MNLATTCHVFPFLALNGVLRTYRILDRHRFMNFMERSYFVVIPDIAEMVWIIKLLSLNQCSYLLGIHKGLSTAR